MTIFYLQVVSRQYLSEGLHINFWDVARSVLIFLGAPLVAGILTRYAFLATKGRDWYEVKFTPRVGPLALLALVYTIVVLFALQVRSTLR